MSRAAVLDNNRMSLRVRTADKEKIMRASALSNTGMTDFIVRTAVEAAEQIIERADRISLSTRDWQTVIDALENSPPLPEKMLAAARALPRL